MTKHLLAIPENAGHLILKRGAVVSVPLLRTDNFIKFCRARGVVLSRERLLGLERLKVFSPVFRVRTPDEDTERLRIPLSRDDLWFKRGWAWDTSEMDFDYVVPEASNRDCEAYYSAFQIDYLVVVLSGLTISLQIDGFLDRKDDTVPIDWEKNGERWLAYGKASAEGLQSHTYRPAVALLCQYISDRYYPQTQTNQRTMKVPVGPRFNFDDWTQSHFLEWNWHDLVEEWDAEEVARLFELTPERLRHAYEGLAVSQSSCDPISSWYQLVQFVSVGEREKLKGEALRAETLRSAAHMLRFLYEDLYGEELRHPNEVSGEIFTHFPEVEVRKDTRRYLEFVVNRYDLNSRPKVSLLVEGPSEEVAIRLIFDRYFGADPGKYGIEIVSLGSVDNATGGRDDKFRAILRLVDYQHHHQTISFLILDNENHASKLKAAAKMAASIHHDKRFVTRPEYIRVWQRSFEFDNFSATEIAHAFNTLCEGRVRFTRSEIADCKRARNPGAALTDLYKRKAAYGLAKPKLAEILVDEMLSPTARKNIRNRPIVKMLERVTKLATRNPFPTRQETWEINQASKFLGKKRR